MSWPGWGEGNGKTDAELKEQKAGAIGKSGRLSLREATAFSIKITDDEIEKRKR